MKMGAGGIIMKQENGGNVQYNGKNFKTIDDDPDMGLGNKKCLQKDYYCGSHRVYLSEEDVKIKKCLCKPDVNMIGYHVCPNLKKMEEIMYRAGREKFILCMKKQRMNFLRMKLLKIWFQDVWFHWTKMVIIMYLFMHV